MTEIDASVLDDIEEEVIFDMEQFSHELLRFMENICDDCKDAKFDGVRLEYHGAPCVIKNRICEPGEEFCVHADIYTRAYDLKDKVDMALDVMEKGAMD